MKKILLMLVLTVSISVNAQKQHLLYREYQNYDTTNFTYSPIYNVLMPCEVDFDDSLVTIGDKSGNHSTFRLESFNMSNDKLIYQCTNQQLNKKCVIVLYVYGSYRYMEVVYTTTNKFKYRVKSDEVFSLNKN